MRRLLLTTLLLSLLIVWSLDAQTPRIIAVAATQDHDSLFAEAQLADLFSPKIANTIRSGLPAMVRLDFRVFNQHNHEVARSLRLVEIRHDIWAQRYHILFDDGHRVTNSFEDMEKICSTLRRQPVAALTSLPAGLICRVRLQVAVVPISHRQNHSWREQIESADLQDPAASESGRSGFSINVSRLLSLFLSGRERVHGVSNWATSAPLQLVSKP